MSWHTQTKPSFVVVLIFLILALCCCAIAAVGALAAWSFLGVPTPAPTPLDLVLATPSSTPSSTPTATSTPLDRVSVAPSSTDQLVPTPTPSPLRPLETDTPRPSRTPSPRPTRAVPTATVSPTPSPPAADGLTTEERLQRTLLPQRDIRSLAERLKKTGPIPQVVHQTPPVYAVGDQAEFWVGNLDLKEHVQITATLRYVTPHLYVWVQEGVDYDQEELACSAENFEARIYPTNRAFFGSEWTPGVDSDPRLHILHSTGRWMGMGVAGYYSSADEYSRLANPYSNEREMFYISLNGALPGTDFYDGVLAHEFQHMIHWANDRNEDVWVSEGCSELAALLNGYDPGGFEWLFVGAPDVQLTTWEELGDSAPHYGASYLFMAYFWGRFGEATMKRVIAHPANGVAGFDAVLAEQGLTFEEVFADWLVANYVDNSAYVLPEPQERYVYPDLVVGPAFADMSHDRYPVRRRDHVHQYAADYVELEGTGDLLISFQGDILAQLAPTDAHSGRYAWWGNRGDDSDATLTRAFDLRAVDEATLKVWMWYDIEEDWDYAYVEVSVDGGQTWDILAGPTTTDSNPNGNSFGPAYTGESDGWIEETFDLSPYAGQEVLVRFESVTDDAVNRAGWLIDDIAIPELDFFDDAESGEGGWEGEGFVYSDNMVAQRYLVQVIQFGRQTQVVRMALDEAQRGTLELHGLGAQVDAAVLVISALAPVTTQVAAYEYTIEPLQ